jgi:hypothetical protein
MFWDGILFWCKQISMHNKHLFYTKQGTSRILEPGLKSLRTIRILEEGMVI